MLTVGSSFAVLGASGFIGGALAQAIEERQQECSRFTRSLPFIVDGELAPALQTADVVFWLVSSIRPATSTKPGTASQDQHALEQLLDLLDRRRSPAPRVLVVSSGGTVYNTDAPPPYTESSPTRGANEYGQAMLAVEELVRERCADHIVLRASNVYGPGQRIRRGQGVVAHWLDAVLRQEPIRVMGDPSIRRDYVYIDDVVDALLAAAVADQAPRIVNVGSGHGTSLGELLDLLVEIIGPDVDIERSPARTFDAPSTWLDVNLAREALGWKATTSLEEGLRRSWQAASAAFS
ncbi:UDP-glucose 4-epimerase [Frankineae bacterium MT45]|nr:UDP-glucose 4-epimerase [Frankineae bacterium MT45]